MGKIVLTLSCLLLVLISVTPVFSQESEELEVMMVTANKMEENVQSVSTSMSVFSGEKVEILQMESVSDIANNSSNFMIHDIGVSGTNAPSMRGLYTDLHSHSVSVGMYVDGVPILDAMGYEQDLVDIERIEVLKGPQGTLYGKSAEAGVVNIVTKKPDNEVRTKVSAVVGTDDKRRGSFSISGPVVEDRLYLSLSMLHDEKDGWIEQLLSNHTVDDTKRRYGRASLRYTPTDSLEVILAGTYEEYDNGQPHMNLSEAGAAAYGLAPPKDRKSSSTFDAYDKTDTFSESLVINWDINEQLSLSSTSAYRKRQFDSAFDFDFSQATLLHWFNTNTIEKFSQEIRVSSSGTVVDWVAGIYGDKDIVTSKYKVISDIPSMQMSLDDEELRGKSGSMFGHAVVSLSDKWSVLGGLRYDYQQKEFVSKSYSIDVDDSWSEVSPKIGVEYHYSTDSMFYTTISKGYISGGFNPYSFDQEYISFDEEKLWSYELGVKSSFFNNSLIFNAAVFYMDIDDAQVKETLDATRSYFTNAAKVVSKGFEFEVVALPLDGLTLNASFGYSHAEFESFSDADGDYKGNKKPYAPEYSYNLGANYRTARGLYCGVNIIGYGEMYVDKGNVDKQDAYVLVNAKIGYEADNFDIYLYGKNIFDKEYDSGYGDGIYVVYSEPGEAGILVNIRF